MEKQYMNPRGMPVLPGFSQVVTAGSGKAVFIAGQVALDESGELVGKDDLVAQTQQVFKNIGMALSAVGGVPDDVVKTNVYVVNYTQDALSSIREVRNRFFARDKLPASTLIGVQALAFEGLLIEIDAIAMLKADS